MSRCSGVLISERASPTAAQAPIISSWFLTVGLFPALKLAPEPEDQAIRRTARSEFGLTSKRGAKASSADSTAAREFAQPEPEPYTAPPATASSSPAPTTFESTAPSSAEQTAAAEFGG